MFRAFTIRARVKGLLGLEGWWKDSAIVLVYHFQRSWLRAVQAAAFGSSRYCDKVWRNHY